MTDGLHTPLTAPYVKIDDEIGAGRRHQCADSGEQTRAGRLPD
ncbi:hypothetical protein ACFC0C_34090 [Streptomyces sp. NPDC056178]